MEPARSNEQFTDCAAADALLDMLDSIAFERWLKGARLSASANERPVLRLVTKHRLQLLEWRILDAVETIAWCRAPRSLRTTPAALAARDSAALAVLALALSQHLSPAERDDLYGIFMQGAGLT